MVYKKYQCRYFHSDGHSKVPRCSQGDHCRFLHPDDPGWPGLKPKPQEKRVTPSLASHKDVRDNLPNKPHAPSSPLRRFEPRAAPLLSQDDLFLKKLLSEDDPTTVPQSQMRRQTLGSFDDHRDRGSDNKRSKDDVLRNENRNRSQRPYEDFSYLGVKKPTSSANPLSASTHKAYLASGTKRKLSEDSIPSGSTVKPNSQPQVLHRTSPLHNTSSVNSNVVRAMPISPCSFASGIRLEAPSSPTRLDLHQEEIVSLFRELSRLVSQATEDARAQARDDKKLKAYTELSSILSKTSSNVPTAVTPTLADILLRHAQGKQRIEEHYTAISGIWNKLFDLFTSDISRTVDSMLAVAVKKITEAADLANQSILSESSAWTETQQAAQASDASGKFCEDHVRNRFSKYRVVKEGEIQSRRDSKRRRVSPSPDVMYTPAKSIVKMEQGMHEILSQMKSKIDEQAQSLQKLMKENNELKASLQRQSGPALRI